MMYGTDDAKAMDTPLVTTAPVAATAAPLMMTVFFTAPAALVTALDAVETALDASVVSLDIVLRKATNVTNDDVCGPH